MASRNNLAVAFQQHDNNSEYSMTMKTKIFISWSEDLSRDLAEVMSRSLPCALQFLETYFSHRDIPQGTRGEDEILTQLSSIHTGIICFTRENTQSQWIHFEAGALAKSVGKSRVFPILFDLDPVDIKGPLKSYQYTKFEKDGLKKLFKDINLLAGENTLPHDMLDGIFERWWPDINEKVQKILKEKGGNPLPSRSDSDILKEVLDVTRSFKFYLKKEHGNYTDHLFNDMMKGLDNFFSVISCEGIISLKQAFRYLEPSLINLAKSSESSPTAEELHIRFHERLDEIIQNINTGRCK